LAAFLHDDGLVNERVDDARDMYRGPIGKRRETADVPSLLAEIDLLCEVGPDLVD
jgi:hypothetical protein